MSVQIGNTGMTSTITRHRAELDAEQPGLWRVSWLSDLVDRNRAITALLVAEHVEAGADNPDHPDWHLVESFADELGLNAHELVARVNEPVRTPPVAEPTPPAAERPVATLATVEGRAADEAAGTADAAHGAGRLNRVIELVRDTLNPPAEKFDALDARELISAVGAQVARNRRGELADHELIGEVASRLLPFGDDDQRAKGLAGLAGLAAEVVQACTADAAFYAYQRGLADGRARLAAESRVDRDPAAADEWVGLDELTRRADAEPHAGDVDPTRAAVTGYLDQTPTMKQPDVLGDILARDHVLVAERAERDTDEDEWKFCGLIRGVPADVFDRLDAGDAEMVDAIVRAATGEVLKEYEVLHVTLHDPAGARIGTREVDQWVTGNPGTVQA
jgi:hypothetical protein